MNYEQLQGSVRSLGLTPRGTVYSKEHEHGSVSFISDVSYNIVRHDNGFSVVAGGGRDEVFEKPWANYRFRSESEAYEYVWRALRHSVAPALLTEEELRHMQSEAKESIARQIAAYEGD